MHILARILGMLMNRYLHEICEPPIIHRNFKSANVLLDDELAVLVSDCGLAPLILSGAVSQLSGQLLTTYGYGAPEFESGVYTLKSDVYSFGVVMLELLTGRMSYDRARTRGEQFLVRWAIPQLHDIDALTRMVDPALDGKYPVKSLSHFADIISRCVLAEPEFRPLMSEVVQDLMQLLRRESPNRSDGD
ncbi:Non-specific serine/threonine protein kinase [Handroanthus impetiginosus]|uniref:Non-specific serine/threonine protein kinase n=1 Tax=Handroanthus impetiginosus TaxID=429701 RepID=A0A2G9GQA0_9LAMI|nr:Non-specific serine/threonine protein kinase [Handroanthus impetiginosus]